MTNKSGGMIFIMYDVNSSFYNQFSFKIKIHMFSYSRIPKIYTYKQPVKILKMYFKMIQNDIENKEIILKILKWFKDTFSCFELARKTILSLVMEQPYDGRKKSEGCEKWFQKFLFLTQQMNNTSYLFIMLYLNVLATSETVSWFKTMTGLITEEKKEL